MNYKQTMDYLAEIATYGSELGLTSVTELLKRLENPQDKLQFIHIGGTNGKGSTAAYVSSILMEEGYKVGRFISPVVEVYEECIQISTNGDTYYIKKQSISKHMTKIRDICCQMKQEGLSHPTIFEVEVAMAMLEFVEQQCDMVVLEVGLGGRLDATNVIQTVVCSVLTSISMDHMSFLGDTLQQIATEKAGIIKPRVPVVSYPQQLEVYEVIRSTCKRMNSTVYEVEVSDMEIKQEAIEGTIFTYKKEDYEIGLLGRHQIKNSIVAITVCHVLNDRGIMIAKESIKQGLKNATWFGRLSVLKTNPYVIVDGAHNPDAAQQLKQALITYMPEKTGIFVMGVFADKEYEKILDCLLPFARMIITVTPHNERALSSEKLASEVKKVNDTIEVVDGTTVAKGLELAMKHVTENEYVLCFGSLSFLGEIKKNI